MSIERDDATTHRPGVSVILHDLAARAEREHDPVLAFTADALLRLHDLYPAADAAAARGTHDAEARVRIHNTITDALVDHLPAITGLTAPVHPVEPDQG